MLSTSPRPNSLDTVYLLSGLTQIILSADPAGFQPLVAISPQLQSILRIKQSLNSRLVEDARLPGPLIDHPADNVHEVGQGTSPLECVTLLYLLVQTFYPLVVVNTPWMVSFIPPTNNQLRFLKVQNIRTIKRGIHGV